MANQVPAKRPSTELAMLENILERAKGYGDAAKAENTRRAYEADWRHFESWCKAHNLSALPALPGTIAAYLAAHASELKVSTLGRRLAAIRAVHLYAGKPIDLAALALRDVWAGIRRTHGGQQTKKRALLTADLRKVVAILPDSVIGIRDRALLLIGFASAMRRSELAALVIGKKPGHRVRFTDNGLVIEIGRSKSDQEGQGAVIGIPFGSHAEPAAQCFAALPATVV